MNLFSTHIRRMADRAHALSQKLSRSQKMAAASLATVVILSIVIGAFCQAPTPGKWEKLENCRLIKDDYFDGDSFHVSHKGKEIIVRLYFVDCPETDTSIAERVREQAQHFGKTQDEVLEVGKYARAVTAQVLSRQFTVLTQYEDAMGRSALPRYYAFVTTGDGQDLGKILVENGLARSFGRATETRSRSSQSLRSNYDRLEDRARRNQVGIYSPEPLKEIARSKEAPETGDIESESEPVAPAPEATPAAAPSSTGKVNLNTASEAQLDTLPGVGPATAKGIISMRPIKKLEELTALRTLDSEAKIEALRPLVILEEPPVPTPTPTPTPSPTPRPAIARPTPAPVITVTLKEALPMPLFRNGARIGEITLPKGTKLVLLGQKNGLLVVQFSSGDTTGLQASQINETINLAEVKSL